MIDIIVGARPNNRSLNPFISFHGTSMFIPGVFFSIQSLIINIFVLIHIVFVHPNTDPWAAGCGIGNDLCNVYLPRYFPVPVNVTSNMFDTIS